MVIKNKSNILTYIIFVLILLVLGIIFSVNLFHYTYKMNADIAAEGILARLIAESGQWMPDSWYVGNEVRLFNVANLAALLYGITGSMILSMGIACCIAACGVVGSAFFLMSSLRLEPAQKALFVLLCMVLPNNYVVAELFYLFAGYYTPVIIVLFLTMGIYAGFLRRGPDVAGVVISLILQFMLGAQSVRGLLVVGCPILAVEVLRNLYLLWCGKEYTRQDKKALMWSILLVVAGFAGNRLPFAVGQSTSRNLRGAPRKLVEVVIPDFLSACGWQNAAGVGKLILILFALLMILGLLHVLHKMWNRKEIRGEEWMYFVLLAAPAASGVILTFTTSESSSRYFFVIIITMGMSAVVVWNEKTKWCLAALAVTVTLLHVSQLYLPILQRDSSAESDVAKVAEFLEEKGYDMAYATFENANTITMMGDGAVKVATVNSVERMNAHRSLSSRDWYVPFRPQKEKTAYIITEYEKENTNFNTFYHQHQDTLWYETQIGKYHIYGSEYNYSVLE